MGWYNSPGSYFLSRLLTRIAQESRLVSKYGGQSQNHPNTARVFGYDGENGPKFRAIHSGTTMDETGHLAALFVTECAEKRATIISLGRQTCPVHITIANLRHAPAKEVLPAGLRYHIRVSVGALVPIIVSFAACAASSYYRDWYCTFVISLGIIANGLSCFVIGSARLTFTHPEPQQGLPPGDGFLTTPEQIILLKGDEGAVNSVTRGRFSLHFHYSFLIRTCGILLMLQSLTQFLLVPQCTLFGQVMFLASIFVSHSYNAALSYLDKEEIQRNMLKRILKLTELERSFTKFKLPTRTSMAVFAVLASGNKEKAREILDYLLPNDTRVWTIWKSAIVDRLNNSGKECPFRGSDWSNSQDLQERSLLEMLDRDAQVAYEGFESAKTHFLH